MILSRLVHVCRIILSTAYAISFVLSCIAFPLLIGNFAQEFGYLDKVETKSVTCTTREKADGEGLFHGEEYVRPSITELEDMKQYCEQENAQRQAEDRYYESSRKFYFIDPYDNCNDVGTQHESNAQRYYEYLCIGKKDGTEVEKKTVIRSKFIHAELAFLFIINIPITILLYLVGYVFFGEKTAFPIRKFRNIHGSG